MGANGTGRAPSQRGRQQHQQHGGDIARGIEAQVNHVEMTTRNKDLMHLVTDRADGAKEQSEYVPESRARQALAAGTPVIGTNIGGIPELVDEGKTGFICEPGDVSSMADAISRGTSAFLDLSAYSMLQRNCRSYVMENCSREKFMSDLVNLYKESIDG